MGLDKIAKLKGRENYDSWKFAAKSYLVIKGYWPCMSGTETSEEKNLQAISALGLLLEPCNYSYVQNCSSAKDAWNALEKAFEDNGVMRRMDLLKYFTRLEFTDCSSMEEYVNKMTSTQQKLIRSGTNIPDDICAQIMLSGLPEQYRPMVMAIANCGKILSTDLVRTNLLQEVVNEPSNAESMVLFADNKNKKKNKFKKKNIVCFNCNKKGHYANKCSSKTNDTLLLSFTSYVAKNNSTSDWFVDSGATAHMTMSRETLSQLSKTSSTEVIVGDNGRLPVECAGDVHTKFANNDNTNFVLKDVQCIPNICANLLSVSQLTKSGKTVVFNKNNCRIFDEQKRLLITAPHVDGLYRLSSLPQTEDSALIVSTDKELWHRRMGHACETNLNNIKNATTGVNFSNKTLDKCIICAKGKKTRASFKTTGTHSKKWVEAMNEEMVALKQNETWELTDLPPERKAIDSKWVFKIKRNAAGEIERYKARLVVRGYSQTKGIDYEETYSPVVRYASIRLLLAMAAKYNLSIHHMDAVTAFLQGEIDEEIYMRQPEYITDGTDKVCRLKKSLYGLKQASRVWNSKLNNVLTEKLGYKRSAYDQCIYFKHSDLNTIILAIYVDDILIVGSNNTMISKLKKGLSSHFKMKDIGAATSVLGMNIERNEDGSISIDQKNYINKVLERFNMMDCNPISTPMDPNQKLSKDMCPKTAEERGKMNSIPYQEAIGCIMFAAQISRPDISFAVSSLSRYNANYGAAHWTAVKRVLRYLKGTVGMKLTYKAGDTDDLKGYCDADWAGDQDDRRSTTGYVFSLQGGAVSWATRRQPTVALSTTEAEFMSMVAAIQEGLWLKRFQKDIFLQSEGSLKLFCDNQGAIQLAKNNNYHPRTKHIDIKHYFIREKLAEGMIDLSYLSTNEMPADILTKAVNNAKLNSFIGQYGLNDTAS